MIASLSGTVLTTLEKSFILECNSIGYEVITNSSILSEVKEKEPFTCFIHTHVREDQLTLFGFRSLEERTFFQQLISVSGVGPKTALEMLNQPLDLIKHAIINEDSVTVSKTPGIGKKTAERIIIELKNKIIPGEHFIRSPQGITSNVQTQEEVIAALQSLGYYKSQITKVLKDLPAELTTTEEIIKFFLQNA